MRKANNNSGFPNLSQPPKLADALLYIFMGNLKMGQTMGLFNKIIYFRLVLALASLGLSACDSNFSYTEVFRACEPPSSSARYGSNDGPVITSPAPGTPYNGTMTVSGTCVDGMDVTISGSGIDSSFQVPCTAGSFSTPVTFNSGEGDKEVDVSQNTFNDSAITDRLCFVQDTIPPVVNITGTGGAMSIGRTTIDIGGVCESGLDVNISGGNLVAPVTTDCRNGRFTATVTFTGPDGLKNVVAEQTDLAGNNGDDDQDYVTDTTAPVVRILNPAPMSLSQNSVNVSGSCETGYPVILSGAGSLGLAVADCIGGNFSSTVILSAGDGVKDIEAAQSDAAGNRGTDNRDFMKDATPPVVAFTGPADGSMTTSDITVTGTCETGLNVTLSGSGLTSSMNRPCNSGNFSADISLTAPDGMKNIMASQTDAAGNQGNDTRNFLRDGTAPIVSIDNPAANAIVLSSVNISGVCENGMNVDISGSGAANPQTATCSANTYTANVVLSAGDGTKNIVVSQTDAAGNTGSDNRDFIRDETGPAVAITSPDDGDYVDDTATIAGTCESGLDVTLSGDLAASVVVSCAAGNFSGLVTFSAPQGGKNIVATQTDAAGNSGSDSRDFVKDTEAPVISILTPAEGSIHGDTATLTGVCEDGLPIDVGGTGTVADTQVCNSGSFSFDITFSVGDGLKQVTVSQLDAASNRGTAIRNLVKDTGVPGVAINAPAVNTEAQAGVNLQGSCEDGLQVDLSGTGLASPNSTFCNSGSFAVDITFSAGDGVKNIIASQTDAAGNVGTDNRDFIRDNSAPTVTITAPAAGTIVSNGLNLQGTCESGIDVMLSGDVSGPVSTNCSAGSFNVDIVLTAGDGNKNVIVTQTDAAGNSASDNRDFVRDSVGPNIAIQNPAADTVAQNGLTVSGVCETGLNVDLTGTGLSAPMTVPCAAASWTADIVFSAGDGNKNIVASQTDAAGNTNSDARNFIKDTTAPSIAILNPAAGTSAALGLMISGSCEDGLDVVLSGDINPMTVSCSSSAWTADVVFSAGDGVKNIVATQTDSAGNSASDNRNFDRDSSAPAIAITAPAANSYHQNGLQLQGTCESDIQVSLSGDLTSPASTTCAAGAFSVDILFTAGDGNKNIVASQTDAAGNIASDNRDFTKDSIGPVVTITAPAANSYIGNPFNVSGACETGLSVDVAGPGVSNPGTAVCAGGTWNYNVTPSAGDGNKRVIASQTDGAGNSGSDTRDFLRDSGAPVLQITAPAALAELQNGLTLQGTCESGIQVDLSGAGLDSPNSATCSGGTFSVAILFTAGDGIKNIIASQTDAAGNTGSDTRDFVRDTAAPAVAIIDPAPGTVGVSDIRVNGTCEAGLTVNLSGAGHASPATTDCSFGSFSIQIQFSAGDGTKNIIASQTDAAGNTGSDNRDFTRDGTAPVVTIDNPAPGTSTQGNLNLSGACESGLVVNLNGDIVPQNVACIGGAYSVTLAMTPGDGSKNVTATQTDTAGNTASDSRSFNRDNTVPVVAITAPAANAFVAVSENISGSCESGINVDLAGDITAPVSVACSGGSFSGSVTFTAGDGLKNIVASQTDAAGNSASDNRSFVRDSSAPAIAITAPAAGTTDTTGLTVSGTCEAGFNVDLTGDITSTTALCAGGTWSQAVVFSAGDGVKNVVASQTDASGNTGSDNRDFNRDSTAPTVAITAPAAGTTDANGLTVSGICESGLNVNLSGDITAASTTCTGGTWSQAVVFSAGDGVKNVVASQTDATGNTGSDNRDFNRDSTAPTVAITAPAAGSTASTGLTVSGTCESGLNVDLSGDITSTSTSCSGGTWSQAVIFSAGDGVKNVVASQTDASGNTASDNRSFNRDGTAPVVAITAPAAGTTDPVGVTLSGVCESGILVEVSGAGVDAPSTTSCAGGAFSTAITFSNNDGTKNVIVSQTDAAGNTGSDNRDFNRDGTAPVVAITAPAAGTTAQTGLTVSGTCESGINVDLSGDITATSASCSGGTWSQAVVFSAGDGTKNIVASQTDASGNTGSDNRNFNRDNTAPLVAITTPAAGTSTAAGLTVSGTCESGLDVNLTGDLTAPVVTPCAGGVFSGDVVFTAPLGNKTVTALQTDASGNTGSDSRVFDKSNSNGYYTFSSEGPGGMVDILFIDDNSASMEAEQAAVGSRFSSFTAELSSLDWQIGITTTDCSGGAFGICGSLLDMDGNGPILTASTPNFLTAFQNTIQRPETFDPITGQSCILTGTCPSGNEQPLLASMTAMDKRNTDNAGFFRNGADLAIVILSDEDEQSSGPPAATQAQTVVNHFSSIWPSGKKFISYGIIIQPGDVTCYNEQRSQFGSNGFYGTRAQDLADLTDGSTVSICEPDYSTTLQQIGEDVTRLSRSIDLPEVPIPGTVSIVYTPAHTSTFSVSGNRVTIDTPAPLGTTVEIFYEY